MYTISIPQLNTAKDNKIVLPKTTNLPLSPSEKLVREEVKKLTESSEELKKLRERINEEEDKGQG